MSQSFRPTSFLSRLVNNLVLRNKRKTGEETLVGIDYKGNQYYEQIEGSQHVRKLDGVVLPKRWYFPPTGSEEDWDREIPPEWEAWMRYRRIEAPTEEEINLNLAVAHMKRVNAARLEEQRRLEASGQKSLKPLADDDVHREPDEKPDLPYNKETGEIKKPKFPVFEEYEVNPGLNPSNRKERMKNNDPFND